MTYSEIVPLMKSGVVFRRRGWTWDAFVFWAGASTFPKKDIGFIREWPACVSRMIGEDGHVSYGDRPMLCVDKNRIEAYFPASRDLVAQDWEPC